MVGPHAGGPALREDPPGGLGLSAAAREAYRPMPPGPQAVASNEKAGPLVGQGHPPGGIVWG